MIKVKFNVPLFDIDVVLIQVEGPKDKDEVMKLIKDYNMEEKEKAIISDSIETDVMVGAVTLHEDYVWTITTVFYKMKDEKTKTTCYGHEKRHIEDAILERMGINDHETAGYLAGFLSGYFKELSDKYRVESSK